MHSADLDIWWSSLTIAQKERIARKGQIKATGAEVEESLYLYPACSCWWNTLDDTTKEKIHDHCEGRHGYFLHEWNEATPYGD